MKKLLSILAATLLVGCGGGNENPGNPPVNQTVLLAQVGAQSNASLSAYNDVVQQIYVGYFGRPADAGGLAYFEGLMLAAGAPTTLAGVSASYSTNAQLRGVIDIFGTSAESAALYPGDNNAFILAIYRNLFNRTADDAGRAYWASLIDRGLITKANAAISIMAGAQSSDALIVQNKTTIASAFTLALDTLAKQQAYSGLAANAGVRVMLGNVSDVTNIEAFQATVAQTISALVAPPVLPPVVTTYSPTAAILNDVTTISFNGVNLVPGMSMTLPDCAGILELAVGTGALRQFLCTPTSTGILTGTLSDKVNGTSLGKFTIAVSPAPQVNTYSPTSTTISQLTTLTFYGTNLTSGLGVTLDGCQGMAELAGGTATQRQFTCTPTKAGVFNGQITRAPNATFVAGFAVTINGISVPTAATVDGTFNGWSGGTVVALTNGQFWQQNDYTYSYSYAYMPKVTFYGSVGQYQMQVAGNPSIVGVTQVQGSVQTISGSFNGWTGQTVIALTNGQAWQQTDFTYSYSYAFMPKVTLILSGGVYKMQVAGTTSWIPVRQLY